MIELPEKFANDIQGKDTYLLPLIVINNSVYLSTGKTTLDGVNYDPLIKSLGSIKQSVDLIEKKFKISSVEMDFYNYDYNNTTLTETMFSSEIMNRPIDVYFKSPSAETLDDCLLAYSGYVKNISENIDIVRLEIEDRTEQTLHKDLPYRYTATEGLADKHKNKPISIVYGIVDNCPIIYNKAIEYVEEDGYVLIADDFYIQSLSTPKISSGKLYAEIKEDAIRWNQEAGGTIYENSTMRQFEIINNKLYIEKTIHVSDTDELIANASGMSGSPIAFGFVEVDLISNPIYTGGRYTQHWNDGSPNQASVDIMAFEDEEGQIPVSNPTEKYYLFPTTFVGESGTAMPHEDWFFGQNQGIDGDLCVLFGINTLNYDVGEGFTRADMATELLMPNDNTSEVLNYKTITVSGNVKATQVYVSGDQILPKLYFNNTDSSVLFVDVENEDDNQV